MNLANRLKAESDKAEKDMEHAEAVIRLALKELPEPMLYFLLGALEREVAERRVGAPTEVSTEG